MTQFGPALGTPPEVRADGAVSCMFTRPKSSLLNLPGLRSACSADLTCRGPSHPACTATVPLMIQGETDHTIKGHTAPRINLESARSIGQRPCLPFDGGCCRPTVGGRTRRARVDPSHLHSEGRGSVLAEICLRRHHPLLSAGHLGSSRPDSWRNPSHTRPRKGRPLRPIPPRIAVPGCSSWGRAALV